MTAPIVQATLNSCVLTTLSNILAQLIGAYRANEPYSLSLTPILQFILFTILTCPPNFLYQQTLEAIFPSMHLAPSNTAVNAAVDGDEKKLDSVASSELVQPKLNVKNTILKFLIDQSLGASLNTLAFIFVMGGLQGQSWEMVKERGGREFWPMMLAAYRLWPMVSLLGYVGLKSVEARQLLGSCAGLGWNIFLSLKAGAGPPVARARAAAETKKEL